MTTQYTLEYWPDGRWLVGRLREAPGVFSQGETLAELEANIREAFELVRSETMTPAPANAGTVAIGVEV
ncbi:MAG: type II toxin-antitoxin system HicB family antitoxin [Armatimonadetes bacterium]|nr:type II toxin-antitoxin system HicB family antitoxin [Armatimonadota bacterium]